MESEEIPIPVFPGWEIEAVQIEPLVSSEGTREDPFLPPPTSAKAAARRAVQRVGERNSRLWSSRRRNSWVSPVPRVFWIITVEN